MHSIRDPLILLAALTIPSSLAAQARPVSVGAFVRVTPSAPSTQVEGTLTAMTASEWTLSVAGGELRSFDPTRVVSLELRTTRRNGLRGALIGAGAGLLFGVAAVSGDDCDEVSELWEGFCEGLSGSLDGPVLVVTSALGAGVGALVGVFVKTDRWVPGVIPSTQRQARALSLSWTLPAPW